MADSATDVLNRLRGPVTEAMRTATARLDPRNRVIVDYHLGFVDAQGVPIAGTQASGKSIRAAMALLSAEAVGGNEAAAMPVAIGVELVHQYSLLHDDIIDGDASRRHRPAAWTVFGTRRTILAGDALAALALEIVARSGSAAATALLSAATRRMVAGQAADMAFENIATVSLDDALAMVSDKTGALLECAASIGALAAGATSAAVAALADYGRHVGLAFQLVDDLIGLWGESAQTGKPVGADIAARKKSLPVVAALAAGGEASTRLAEIYARPGVLDADAQGAALDAIDASGGRAWAQRTADAETEAALGVLDGAPIRDGVREQLRAVTVMLCTRDH